MSEQALNQLINLHEQPSLQMIEVREGVVLRPMDDLDAPDLITILEADPSIRDCVTVAARMHNDGDVRAEVAAYRADPGLIRYVVVEDGARVGLVSLWRDEGFFGQAPNPDAFGFGYFLHPAARGKGLVTASLSALMRTTQDNLSVSSFMAFCEDSNTESVAALRRVGLEPTDQTYPEPTHGWMERLYQKRIVTQP